MTSILTTISSLAKSYLISTHSSKENLYNIITIANILDNEKTHLVSQFKDYLIYDDDNEFLKRYYKRHECVTKLTHFFEFYEMNSKIFPNYVSLFESKYLFKNIKRKQKMLDHLREIEENRNNTHSTHSDIFTSNAIESICDDIDEDNNEGVKSNSRDISVERLIDVINDYDKDNNDDLPDSSFNQKGIKYNHDHNHEYNKSKQVAKHYKKFIREDDSKSKSKSKSKNKIKKKINKEKRTLSDISEKMIIEGITSNSNNNINIIINDYNNTYNNNKMKKEDSKVVLIMKHDSNANTNIINLNKNKARVTESTSNSKNKQINIKTVKVNRGIKSTNANKKYVQKINIFSDSEEQKSVQKIQPKSSKVVLTEKNTSTTQKTQVQSKINNSKIIKAKNDILLPYKNSSSSNNNHNNKKEKTEAKSMPKLSTKGKLGLFPIGNRFKSSNNPQTARINIETKAKPIIIKDSVQRGNNTLNNKSQNQNQKKTVDQTTNIHNANKTTNQTQSIKASNNTRSNLCNSTEKNKNNSIIKAIPNLHIDFFCQRTSTSKSNEKSNEKVSNTNITQSSNIQAGIMSSNKHITQPNPSTQQHQVNNNKKVYRNSSNNTNTNTNINTNNNNDEHNIRAFIINNEMINTNDESSRTDRRSSKQNASNPLVITNKNSCLKSSQLTKQKPSGNNNNSNQINKKTSVSVSSSHRLNHNQINSSVNSQKIASIEINKVTGPLTTRTEHSNPPIGKTMPKDTKIVIHRIVKSNLVNNTITRTKNPTSPSVNRNGAGGSTANKQKPNTAIQNNSNSNIKLHNKAKASKLKNFAEVVKDINSLNKKLPLSSKRQIVNI